MKQLLIFSMLILNACVSKPKLESGSCYDVSLYSTYDPDDEFSLSTTHELSQFKVVNIFNFKGRKHYAIQVLKNEFVNDNWDLVPLYPKSKSYGYAAVEQFDKYISPNAEKFSPVEEKTVKCNPITDSDIKANKKSSHTPLME